MTQDKIAELLAAWDEEVREHGIWTSGHSLAAKMAAALRSSIPSREPLVAALQRIVDWSDCECEHDNDDCCANVADTDFHCPGCIAAKALREAAAVRLCAGGNRIAGNGTQCGADECACHPPMQPPVFGEAAGVGRPSDQVEEAQQALDELFSGLEAGTPLTERIRRLVTPLAALRSSVPSREPLTPQAVIDEMTRLMQPQANGRYLDAAETWNALLEWLREAALSEASAPSSEPLVAAKGKIVAAHIVALGLIEVARTETPETPFSRVMLERSRRLRDTLEDAENALREAAGVIPEHDAADSVYNVLRDLATVVAQIARDQMTPNGVGHESSRTTGAILHAERRLADLGVGRPSGGWQPIATAPKDASPVLTTKPCWVTPRLMCWLDGVALGRLAERRPGWRLFDGRPESGPYDPTHWMPLPAPPAVPSTEQE